MSTTTARRSARPARPASLRRIARLRAEAEAEIERLIAFLDALDGDPDLEDDDPAEDDDPKEESGELEDDGAESRRRYADARRERCTRIVRQAAGPGVYAVRREFDGGAMYRRGREGASP